MKNASCPTTRLRSLVGHVSSEAWKTGWFVLVTRRIAHMMARRVRSEPLLAGAISGPSRNVNGGPRGLPSSEYLCPPRRPGASHIGCLDHRQIGYSLLCEIQELPEESRTKLHLQIVDRAPRANILTRRLVQGMPAFEVQYLGELRLRCSVMPERPDDTRRMSGLSCVICASISTSSGFASMNRGFHKATKTPPGRSIGWNSSHALSKSVQ
jgi:hypothetical protein